MSRASMQRLLTSQRASDLYGADGAYWIELSDLRMRVTPAVRQAIGELDTASWSVVEQPDCGYRPRLIAETMMPQPRLWPARISAGMVPIVATMLLDRGIDVTCFNFGLGPNALPSPVFPRQGGQPPADLGYIYAISQLPTLLVRFARGSVDVGWLIAQVALAYLGVRVAVMTATRAEANRLSQRIQRWVPDVAVSSLCFPAESHARILVGTIGGLGHQQLLVPHYDILIVPNALTALREQPSRLLFASDSRFRVVGLLPMDAHVSPYERDRLIATYGLVRHAIWRHGYYPCPVTAVWQPLRGPRLERCRNDGELRRAGYVRHQVRNRRVAHLAASLAAGATARAEELCPGISEAIDMRSGVRILVLTESLDHALALARCLPDWPILAGECVIAEGLSSAARRLLGQRCVATMPVGNLIATATALPAVDLMSLDVVIWAGGGPGGAPLPPEQLVVKYGWRHRLVVIDVEDAHHGCLRTWARQRDKAYEELGWLAPGERQFAVSLRRFLAARPNLTEQPPCTR